MEDPGIRAWFAQVLVHEPHLRSYLRRVVGDRVDINDVVQETYARLIALSPSQRGAVRTIRAFLFTTARHVALDHLRRLPVVSLDALTEVASTRVVTEGEVEPSPDQNLNTCQELELLARVIASLPDKCREVLTLRKIHGLSQKEIAARLGIAEHTVEKHVSYGVRLCAARMLETIGPMDSSAAAVPATGQGRVRNVE